MNAPSSPALRPALPDDTPVLAAILQAAVFELAGEDYEPDQQEAWAATVDDEAAFGTRLAGALTLVATLEGEPVGFVALKDNRLVDLLYVHPNAAGQGVGSLLLDAVEKLAAARGATALTADASDTALPLFQKRGYVPQRRNTVPLGPVWLGNTTVEKKLTGAAAPPSVQ